jgi:hypothetical protein
VRNLKQNILFILGIIVCLPVSLYSQDYYISEPDSVSGQVSHSSLADLLRQDSVYVENTGSDSILARKAFVPNSTRAVIYSAIFPGLGQIYNRKYWKLPIVYGGFLGCIYAISWNNTQYTGYKSAYRDFTDSNPDTNSWRDYKYYGYSDNPDEWTAQQREGFTNALKNKKDYFRRYRDLSYIITVGLYAICMIDAYVDAQLFEFDISEDLSFRVNPVFFEKVANNSRSFGLQCSFTF